MIVARCMKRFIKKNISELQKSYGYAGTPVRKAYHQPRSQGLRGETVTKTLVKFVLLFQNFGKKIACAVRHNRIAITVEYGCVSLRMRFFSQNFGTIKRIDQGLRHRLTAKALGPRLAYHM